MSTPTAEVVRTVSVAWRGRREIMTMEEAEELRLALGKALCLKTNSVAHIIWVVCDLFQLPVAVVKSDVRTARVVLCRQCCMFVLHTVTNMTLGAIGAEFKREHGQARDTGTVQHAIKRVRSAIATERGIAELIATAQTRIAETK